MATKRHKKPKPPPAYSNLVTIASLFFFFHRSFCQRITRITRMAESAIRVIRVIRWPPLPLVAAPPPHVFLRLLWPPPFQRHWLTIGIAANPRNADAHTVVEAPRFISRCHSPLACAAFVSPARADSAHKRCRRRGKAWLASGDQGLHLSRDHALRDHRDHPLPRLDVFRTQPHPEAQRRKPGQHQL